MEYQWWDNKYAYRRNLAVSSPFSHSVKRHPITFVLPNSIKENNKTIQETYDDLEVVFDNEIVLDRYIVDYQGFTYITFEAQTELHVGQEISSYKIYYGNPNITVPPLREPIVSLPPDVASDSSELNSYLPLWAHWPSEANDTENAINYTRPSQHWKDGRSSNPRARATFKGAFSRVRLISETDSNSGFLIYRIDNSNKQELDTYSSHPEVRSVFEWEVQNGFVQELSISPAGYSRYKNSSADINIKAIQYANYIEVKDMGEEVKSLNWGSFIGKA